MQAHKLPEARQELERALGQSQKLGLQPLTVKAQYLLATALRTSGEAGQAVGHYQAAIQILESMQKESGAEKLLLRSDLAAIYKDSVRWSQSKN